MSFEDAVSHLDSLGVDAMKKMAPSLHRIEAVCEALDHPERALNAIHITGTNGKTSTARIASALLGAAGLSVGTYTSPHLQSIRERIVLNGEPVEADIFGAVFDHLRPYLEMTERSLDEQLTYFEILTAMFFLWAAEQPVDAAVVEVGLGGRWDATNLMSAPVAVITNVALDHTGLLGADRTTIAAEKAGIIKPDSIVVSAERTPEVLGVIRSEAEAAGAGLSLLGADFELLDNRLAVDGRYLTVRTSSDTYDGVFLPLHGAHQGVNAAVALEAASRFVPAQSFEFDLVQEAFSSTFVPGRLETVRLGDDSPTVVLDVAHNPDGASALVSSLAEAFAFDRVLFVVGILSDKDHRGILIELSRLDCTLFATQAKSVRSVAASDLKVEAEQLDIDCEVVDDVAKATDQAIAAASIGTIVCVTGSHYVVGEARDHLLGELER
jgi:dihydrofolate synthase/folylpolyglutamate synthase